jgi:hypothetical protein
LTHLLNLNLIQNLQNSKEINNLFARVVALTNAGGQQRSFKFTNITAPNGIFSLKYLFPDSYLYRVITKIDSKDFASLASFNVFVPSPPPASTVNLGNLNPIVIPAIGAIIATSVGVALILKIKKRNIKLKIKKRNIKLKS